MTGFGLTFGLAEYLRVQNFSAQAIGWTLSLSILLGIIGKMNLPRLLLRFELASIWCAGCLLFVLGCASLFAIPDFPAAAWIGRSLLVVGYGTTVVCGSIYIQQQTKDSSRLMANMSVFTSYVFLGILLASTIYDVIPQHLILSKNEWSFAVAVGFGSLACLFVLLAKPSQLELPALPADSIWKARSLILTWKAWSALSLGSGFVIIQAYLLKYLIALDVHTTSFFFASYAVTAFLRRC